MQGWKFGVPVSTEHWKLEPASLEEKAKVGVWSLVLACGAESIAVAEDVRLAEDVEPERRLVAPVVAGEADVRGVEQPGADVSSDRLA